jgi:DHA1 family quinolone resistance protein-like MFS transporter
VKSYAIQFLYNVALSSAAVFTPIYAQQLGASDIMIGYIGMVYGLSIFISGMYFGRQADVKGRRRFMMIGLFLASLLSALQALSVDPFLLMLSRFGLGFAAGMFPPALVAYAHDEGKLMGKFAAMGSLGFGTGNLLLAFVAGATWLYGALSLAQGVYITGSIVLAAAFAIALTLKPVARTKVAVPPFPLDVIKRNRDVYLSFFIRHTGANAVWIIFPIFVLSLSPRTPSGGPDYTWLGIIYAANALSQGVIMQFIDPFDGRRLVVAGEGLTILTFVGFYFSTNHIHLLVFAFPLAASWSCLYVGSLKTIMERSPEKATASGLLTSTTSMAAIFGPLIGGLVSQVAGYRQTILFGAGLTLVALVAFKFLTESVDRQYESGPPSPAP